MNLPPRPKDGKKWNFVGWHGMSLWVPEDWTFIPSKDNEDKRLKIISPTTWSVQARIQHSKKEVDLHPVLDAYLKTIESEAKSRRIPFTGRVDEVESGLEYTWRTDRKTIGFVKRCPECRNIVLAEVTGEKDSQIKHFAHKILVPLTEHHHDGWKYWGCFGLITAAPDNYKLDSFKFTSGYLSITLRHQANTIVVNRWGLADQAMGKYSLKEWSLANAGWSYSNGEFEQTVIQGHEALLWTGKLKLGAKLLSLRSLKSANLPAFNVQGAAWQCNNSNRLFSVTWIHRKPVEFKELIARTICHFED